MSHIISGLLWNTCLAGGLAIVLFLAQQTRYLRIRPHVCHALWLLVLVKLISPTFFAVPVSIGWARSGQEKNERLAVTAPAIGNATSGSAEPIRTGGEEATPAQTLDAILNPQFAVAVSALGSLALLLTCLSRVRLIGRLVRHTEPASQWIQERVAVASRQMRLKRVPSVRIVHGTISPFLWGTWRRPRIILPSGLISPMAPESVELIIQHELAHYARRDHWTNSFATTLAILFWWNPVVWWARRELRIQQEWCCDRMVLAQDHSRSVRYAETLLAAVDFVESNAVTYPSPATTFGSCSTLEDKLESLVDKFWRAERIGELEGTLAELKTLKEELAEEGEDKARQRVEAFVADQAKLLKQVRELHKIVETDDEQRIEKLEKQIDQREESLALRIEEFHLERHMIEARQEGEDVQELEAELKEVRKALRELTSDSN